MAETKELGPLFVYTMRLPKQFPMFYLAPTQEIDSPFRRSNRSLVIHIGRHALVIGRWRHSGLDEEKALLASIEGVEDYVLDSGGHIRSEFE